MLARTPPGGLPTDEDFKLLERPIPEPVANQMLTRTIYLSLDPYQWGRKRRGVEAVGDVCHGRSVSQVVKSNLPAYTEGDFVFNTNGWQTYGLTGAGVSGFEYMFTRKLDPAQAPISTAVGIMGMLGLTAYAGMALQCQPQAGETVVVSAASGGVGQIAGQIAKIFRCRVMGIAGIQEKCDFVTGVLGFDACVSHKSATLAEDLRAACPAGIDVYFENVGGQVFQAVLPLLNQYARISLCGLVSQYGHATPGNPHDRWMAQGKLTFERQRVQVHQLHVRNFVAAHQAHFFEQMAGWIRTGTVKYKEDLWPGLEQAPKAFRAMLEGGNFGKTLVGVGEDPTLDEALKERRAGSNVLSGSRK
ncbi:MAG: NADP-dependent oxidoreductase [Nitrospinae bacterium]|nr:NADP-dependent oxidoreductase [Nitrospinota bacterium]